MAAPQVSGLAALLIQYYQDHFGQVLKPLEVKALLQGTAVNPDGSPNTGPKDNAVGAGRVSAGRAFVAPYLPFPSPADIMPPSNVRLFKGTAPRPCSWTIFAG